MSFVFIHSAPSVYNLKTMGMANIVRQGLPICTPGFHFGIILTTRMAS